MPRFRMRASLWAGLLLVASAGVVSQGVTASATTCTGKCALGNLSPSSVGAGSTTTVDFALTNEALSLPLGSADLTVPSGFVITPGQPAPVPSAGSASISSNGTILELRNLNLAPGATATVSFEVTAPCAVTATAWSLVANEDDDFSGHPTEDFTTDAGSGLTTSVTGACILVFGSGPANALLNTNITSQGFNSTGAPVAVEAEDGNGSPVAGVTVTLSLLPAGSGATLSGTLSSVTASNGLATFGSPGPALTINQTGYFQLLATAPAFTSSTSGGFQITATAQVCSTNPCATSTTGKSSAASATAINEQSGDVLSLGLGGFSYSCDNASQNLYKSVSQATGTDVWQSSGTTIDTGANGQVTIEIFKATAQQSPNHGAAHFQICYASTQSFTPRPGTSILTTTAPGSITLYYGLLPDCAGTPAVPCVVSRHKDNAGDILLTYDGTGDFWGQG